jgi:hypothetical protein
MKYYQDFFSSYKLSAMTTDEDWGLRKEIANKHKLQTTDIPVYMFSKWGGRTDHLDEFVNDFNNIYLNRSPSEYVLIVIGGNDYCKKKTPEEFRNDYRKYLDKVLEIHPNSQIFISDIPPLPQLRKYDYKYSDTLSCTMIRHKLCKRMFFEDAIEVFLKFNLVIKEIYDEYSKKHSNIKFSNKASQLDLSRNDISFDCFHPSVLAHKKLSIIFKEFLN